MTREQILTRFPHATESTIQRNLSSASQLPHSESQQHSVRQGHPQIDSREEAGQDRYRVGIESRRRRLCDPDNLFVKPIIDALRYARLIADDSLKHIELSISQTKVALKGEERTVITITPL